MIDYPTLWQQVLDRFELSRFSIHGPSHWERVEENGLLICKTNDADRDVVKLFALFHDSCRWSDGYDPEHGQRGAELAIELHEDFYRVSESQLELLVLACQLHHQGTMTDDPTIGTCFDADRLDLGRVGVTPDPEKLCTAEGKRLAQLRNSTY